jgi:hypothetical protein
MDAFIHLRFLTGCSPDEIRGLYRDQIDDLDSEAPGFDVTRTLRHNSGTKTVGRRRGLGLPDATMDWLKCHAPSGTCSSRAAALART